MPNTIIIFTATYIMIQDASLYQRLTPTPGTPHTTLTFNKGVIFRVRILWFDGGGGT